MSPRWLRYVVSFCLLSQVVFGLPLGNPKAPKGGDIVIGYPDYPKSLLFYLSFGELAEGINLLVLETLLDTNPETYESIPLLAKSWTTSKDKKTFTFKIDPQAQFSDGKPVTAEDVKFTWDVLHSPKNKTAPFRAWFASIQSCEVVDRLTVRFRAKTIHFKNLEKVGGFFILPKHFYSKGNFNKSFNSKLLGSGPYTLQKAQRGRKVILKRNPKYWAKDLPQNIGKYNFDRVTFKSVRDYNVQFEAFKRGDIDYFYFLVSKMWVKDTNGPLFKKNYIKKLKVSNATPFGTQGIGWNLRNPLFKDVRVRRALSHLMNRKKWIRDLFYGQYVPSTGTVAVNSPYRHPANKPLEYNPKKAKKLLKEAGWTKIGKDGVLQKGKLRFEFDMLTENQGLLKFLTLYQEDLKKMGIKMNARVVDWATGMRLTDDRKFDARTSARGRGVHPSDFASAWGSQQADIKGSSNFTGYKNPEVDKLAAQIDQTFDKKTRVQLVRKIDSILSNAQPVSFTYEPTFFRLGHWNKFSFPGKGYFRYSNWKTVYHYWWYDSSKATKLSAAKKKKKKLNF